MAQSQSSAQPQEYSTLERLSEALAEFSEADDPTHREVQSSLGSHP